MANIDNSSLIYDYTEKLYNARSANIDSLNVRVATVLVSAVGLVKLVSDLPHVVTVFNYQFYSRCLCFGLIVLCISICFANFLTKFGGGVADPYVLCDKDYIDRETLELRFFIIFYWAKSIDEFEDVISRKAWLLNISVVVLFLALLFLSIASFPLIV